MVAGGRGARTDSAAEGANEHRGGASADRGDLEAVTAAEQGERTEVPEPATDYQTPENDVR